MTDQTKVNWIHVLGVSVCAACYALAFTVLKTQPAIATALCSLATGLYGAMGFKPLPPVVSKMLEALEPQQVAQVMRASVKPTAASSPPPPAGTQP
jgi:hypothetical protein